MENKGKTLTLEEIAQIIIESQKTLPSEKVLLMSAKTKEEMEKVIKEILKNGIQRSE